MTACHPWTVAVTKLLATSKLILLKLFVASWTWATDELRIHCPHLNFDWRHYSRDRLVGPMPTWTVSNKKTGPSPAAGCGHSAELYGILFTNASFEH